MKDRYWMIKWATDQLLDPPEPEEKEGGGMTITSNIAELQAELNKLRRERDLYRMTLEVLSKETPNLKYLNQFWCKIAQEALKDERIS